MYEWKVFYSHPYVEKETLMKAFCLLLLKHVLHFSIWKALVLINNEYSNLCAGNYKANSVLFNYYYYELSIKTQY